MHSKTRIRYKSVPHISREHTERIPFPSIHSNLEQHEEPKQAQTSKEQQQNHLSQQQQCSLKELSTCVDISESQLVTLQQLQQYQQPQQLKSNMTTSVPGLPRSNPSSYQFNEEKIETRRQISKTKFEEEQRKIFDQHLNHMQKSIDFSSLFSSTNHNDHLKSSQHQEIQQQSQQQQSSLFSSLTPALKQTVNTRFSKEVANYNGKKLQGMNKLRKPWARQSGSQTIHNLFEQQPSSVQEPDDQTITSSNRFIARKNQQSLFSKRKETPSPSKPFESLLLKNGEEEDNGAVQEKRKSKLRGIRQYSDESEQSQTPIVLLKLGSDNSGQDTTRFKNQDAKTPGNSLMINLNNINNNNDTTKPKPRRQLRRGLPYLSFEDTYTQFGQLCTNCTDKFEFFRYVPIGCMITLTKKYLKEDQKDSRGNRISSKVLDDQGSRSLIASSPSPRINQHPSNNKQLSNKPKKNIKNSPTANNSKSDYLSILAKQEEISRAAREAQIGKFCVMSKRMSVFFNEADNPYNSTSATADAPAKPPDQQNHNAHHACTNIELFERFSEQCREFFRCMQLLFNLDKNRNKNINFLFRLIANKTYLSNEVLDIQFRLVNMAAVQTLENSLINENIIKNYFPPNLTLFSIMEDTYMKDLIYINSSFQMYLNKQQVSLAGKMSSIIQQEYQMVKQKEKDIILDKLENNGNSSSNGSLLLNSRAARIKKSYTFFNSYLYNIQPRRNTYKEIEEFEKHYGQFSHLNQIDRDIFMNLEKSFEEIRASNKE